MELSSLIIIPILLVVSSLSSTQCQGTLYTEKDLGLSIIEGGNFSSFLSHRQNVVWLQFYNSWCGHCIKFAPTFKTLAKDILSWRPVIDLAVINCAEDKNAEACREYEINLYPSLRFYWINYEPLRDYSVPADSKSIGDPSVTKGPAAIGTQYDGELEGTAPLRRGIIDFLVNSWSRGAPREWPDLMPFSATSKEQFFNQLPVSKKTPIVVIVESSTSYIGREVILDLSGYQDKVTVLRVHDLNKELVSELLSAADLKHLPKLLEVNIEKRTADILCCSGDKFNEDDDHRKMFTHIIEEKYAPEALKAALSSKVEKKVQKPRINKALIGLDEPVYMDDLYNALRYTMFNELLRLERLNSTQLAVMKAFISVVNEYFPFDQDKPASFFKLMAGWASTKEHHLDTHELAEAMKTIDKDTPLPAMKPYQGCAGSQEMYRGYPCSVWTLFHVLAVSEYHHEQEDNYLEVLPTMRAYITNFFGCSECAQNFAKEAANLEHEIKSKAGSVLWLWRTHNRVNQRLAGDLTEDPYHPKVQYPTKETCPKCHYVNGTFIEPPTLDFLVERYRKENIIKSTVTSDLDVKISNDVSLDLAKVSELPAAKVKQYYSMLTDSDISFCLFLYILSAGIIITIFFVMRRRKRKGYKYLA
ncbi:Sulfhydryl oxidase 1 [Halotydeus destructor]|nr:Sulfhydryl oxidase 1 [Halotydeus destructor]